MFSCGCLVLSRQKIVLIGASTGGPGHLKYIVSKLNPHSNNIYIIAQHMTFSYMESFVSLLNSLSPIPVKLSDSRIQLIPNRVYVCSRNSELYRLNQALYLQSVDANTPYEPSVDLLFISAAQLTSDYDVISIVLTGIGDDGAEGSMVLSRSGALAIAESEKTAIVYGMPKQVSLYNKQAKILSLPEISNYLELL